MKTNFLYGTAWKEELTSGCVFEALKVGFRGIDTANQRKHYNEPGVGEGLSRAYDELNLRREDLFIQTKFTYARGQDHRKPYNENDPYKEQVRFSLESSLRHLGTDYLDSLILHGPFSPSGISKEDEEVWREMEALCRAGLVEQIGVSNVTVEQLKKIYDFSSIKPKFVQIRCFAERKWEQEHRRICSERDMVFQGFSLLTANHKFLGGGKVILENRNVPKLEFQSTYEQNSVLGKIISETNKTPAQIVFKFCQQIGILPITGTRSPENMRLNLDIDDFELSDEQLKSIENIAF